MPWIDGKLLKQPEQGKRVWRWEIITRMHGKWCLLHGGMCMSNREVDLANQSETGRSSQGQRYWRWVSLGKSRWGIVWNYFRNVGLFNCKGTRDVGTMRLILYNWNDIVYVELSVHDPSREIWFLSLLSELLLFQIRLNRLSQFQMQSNLNRRQGMGFPYLYWWMVVGSTSGSIVGRLLWNWYVHMWRLCSYQRTGCIEKYL